MFHTNIVRLMIPACIIKKCYTTLSDVMQLCIKFSCCDPRIGIPAVWVFSVMFWICFCDIVNCLWYFSCRYRITIHFYAPRRQWRCLKKLTFIISVTINFKAKNRQFMAGILTLKDRHLMNVILCCLQRDFYCRLTFLWKQKLCLCITFGNAKIVIPVIMLIAHMDK